jgi:hypothetical protein
MVSIRWFTAVTVATIVIGTAVDARAYDLDFHYYVVYALLRARGYDAASADTLAGFSQYVDDNAATEPLFQFPATRAKFHFAGSSKTLATRENIQAARDQVERAFATYQARDADGKFLVGAALHLLADTFSHDTFTAWWVSSINCRAGSRRPCIGHWDTDEDGHAPDHPYNDPSRAIRAAQVIYELIPVGSGAMLVPWTEIERDLLPAYGSPASPPAAKTIARRIAMLQNGVLRRFPEEKAYKVETFRQFKTPFEAAVKP